MAVASPPGVVIGAKVTVNAAPVGYTYPYPSGPGRVIFLRDDGVAGIHLYADGSIWEIAASLLTPDATQVVARKLS